MLAGEIGMPFHAAHQHDAIAFEGVAIHENFDAFGGPAERNHVERADHGAAHGLRDDAVMRQDIGLAFGGRRAVAAHGGKQKRLRALRFPKVDHRAHNGGDVADAPAAHANGDARSGLPTRDEW